MKDRVAPVLLGVIAVLLVGMCFIAREKGAITVATPGAELQLKSGLGSSMILRSGSEPTAVPARVYIPTSLGLTWEQDGNTWKASSWGPWGKLARIKIEGGRTTAI